MLLEFQIADSLSYFCEAKTTIKYIAREALELKNTFVGEQSPTRASLLLQEMKQPAGILVKREGSRLGREMDMEEDVLSNLCHKALQLAGIVI